MESKNNKLVMIIICIGLLLIGIGVGYSIVSSSKSDKKESNETNNKDEKNNNFTEFELKGNVYDANGEKFDFESMKSSINELLNNNTAGIYIAKCTDLSTDEKIETKYDYIKVDASKLVKIINILKRAESYEKGITFSIMGCPKNNVSLIIGAKDIYGELELAINYADASDTLLVGFEQVGYAFKYDDAKTINEFIENLK